MFFFFSAKEFMISSNSNFLASSLSMLKVAKSSNLSYVIVHHMKFLMSLSLLKDRSADATVTGKVQNTLKVIQTLGNISPCLI